MTPLSLTISRLVEQSSREQAKVRYKTPRPHELARALPTKEMRTVGTIGLLLVVPTDWDPLNAMWQGSWEPLSLARSGSVLNILVSLRLDG